MKRKRRLAGRYQKKTKKETSEQKEKELRNVFFNIYGKEPTGHEFVEFRKWRKSQKGIYGNYNNKK
ncbi:MAG: hypothetical protein PHN89_02780 [Candidatus Pacebacteria bacterium]|nr:hypothetical protein [Candidatus Paceibacterota bacterium]